MLDCGELRLDLAMDAAAALADLQAESGAVAAQLARARAVRSGAGHSSSVSSADRRRAALAQQLARLRARNQDLEREQEEDLRRIGGALQNHSAKRDRAMAPAASGFGLSGQAAPSCDGGCSSLLESEVRAMSAASAAAEWRRHVCRRRYELLS